METPPRAWGRLGDAVEITTVIRNTPTCVGKTIGGIAREFNYEKHPHVRGEDELRTDLRLAVQETPPRAWGRRRRRCERDQILRNTPTCVGKTTHTVSKCLFFRKHPHVRGEDDPNEPDYNGGSETPPRAWGRPVFVLHA